MKDLRQSLDEIKRQALETTKLSKSEDITAAYTGVTATLLIIIAELLMQQEGGQRVKK